jgi:hypothetical protein
MDKIQEKTAEIKASATGSVGGFPPVPATKILAIGRFLAPLTPEQRKAILPSEVPDTLRLYLAGKIDQWWFRQDGKGPVFLMNVTSVEEARALLTDVAFGRGKTHRVRSYRAWSTETALPAPRRRLGEIRSLVTIGSAPAGTDARIL